MRYKKILLAIDFFAENVDVIQTAKELAGLYSAELNLVHVNPPLALAYGADGFGWNGQIVEIESQMRADKKKRLAEIGSEVGLIDKQIFLLDGRPAPAIHRLCEQEHIDLLVIGTHGQSGFSLLLGSTASSVLHGSDCDVLAVRVHHAA
jgi:universal stress protein A